MQNANNKATEKAKDRELVCTVTDRIAETTNKGEIVRMMGLEEHLRGFPVWRNSGLFTGTV